MEYLFLSPTLKIKKEKQGKDKGLLPKSFLYLKQRYRNTLSSRCHGEDSRPAPYMKGQYHHKSLLLRRYPSTSSFLGWLVEKKKSLPNQKLMFYPKSISHLISKRESSMVGLIIQTKETALKKPHKNVHWNHTGPGTQVSLVLLDIWILMGEMLVPPFHFL